MHVNEREANRMVWMQQVEVKKVQEFKCLILQYNANCGKEMKTRMQAGLSGWRKVSGDICDRTVSVRVKGKAYKMVVRPSLVCGLEVLADRRGGVKNFAVGITRMDRMKISISEYQTGMHILETNWERPG